eukprot:Plantae.Rhodophyta-Hildenbrandia_rubra.ctg18715.p1 GENE.Plantae.Rhodophyta-Hildenbrandia_rubra.ctg18715~~Plantae.Rhodophyta-Hildenbrandia_rubra.ctg18715.p1  ORF type:complete len:529 (-),score=62.87 Plantae.Rhodophyta-Hildenbrandia_rubra.ctg18715:19-1605(-)
MATNDDAHPNPEDKKRFFNAVRLRDVGCVSSILIELSDSLPQNNIIDGFRDNEGHTCLHWAALDGAIDLIRWLLDREPFNIDVISNGDGQRGQTPLMWASISNRGAVVDLLLQRGAAADVKDERGHTALLHAVQYGHVGICKRLMDTRRELITMVDNDGSGVLHWAAYRGCHGVVRYFTLLWPKESDVDLMDCKGLRPLHRACQRGDQIITLALLRAKADMFAKTTNDDDGQTPIDFARTQGYYACVATLIAWQWGEYVNDKPKRYTFRRHIFVWFFYLCFAISYYLLITRIALFSPPPQYIMMLFHLFLILLIASSVLCTYVDPGYVKCGTVKSFREYLDHAISNGRDDKLSPAAYCYSCLAPRPPRSKHCRPLDRCVMRFDHWCPWMNNAIGANNHRALMIFVVVLPVVQWMYIAMACNYLLFRAKEVQTSFFGVLKLEAFLCVLCGIHAILTLFSITLFVAHAKLIATGRTTNEQINVKRYAMSNNPYDQGVQTNCIEFWKMTGRGTEMLGSESQGGKVLLSNNV